MPETEEYDLIFAALKHPVRRQILLLLEQKGEAAFMDIQKNVGIDDTGLMSYHLKELAPLVEQSARGKYCLSEIGQTSIALFRKVEREKQRTTTAVHREIERSAGIAAFLFISVGVTLMAPLSVDTYVSVQNLSELGLSLEQMVGLFFVGLIGIISGAIAFAFCDRHYFSQNAKTNVIHSLIFATGISLLLVFSAYVSHGFEEATLSIAFLPSKGAVGWLFMVLHSVSLLSCAPLVAYGIGKITKRH